MAKDVFHEIVKAALEREGWKITHDPFIIRIEDVRYEIDLGAEILLAAEREGRKIAVEVKSFVEQSTVHAFHLALGQYLDYLVALEEVDADRVLYLAVPLNTYNWFFTKAIVQKSLKRASVRLIVYDVEAETIVQWIS